MCTLEKRGNIFFLTLTGDNEHHLSPSFVSSLRSLLSNARYHSTRASVLVTSSHGRFFSNGFDLIAQCSPTPSDLNCHMSERVNAFKSLIADFISLPMPTIAAVTGHACAAGFILARAHDYVLMRGDRGFLYMSELDIGFSLPDYFFAMVRAKIGTSAGRRDMVLKAAKLKADEAVRMGIVDSAHHSAEDTVEAAMHLGEQLAERKWDGQLYAQIRKSLYPELCTKLGLEDEKSAAISRL